MRCKLYRDWYFRGKLIKAGRTVTVTPEQAQWLYDNGYLTPPVQRIAIALDAFRANSGTNLLNWRGHSTVGGSINSSDTQFNSGTLTGFYINDGTLAGEQSGVGEGAHGGVPTSGFPLGNFINRFFPFIDPADISGELPRGGMSGGPGDTAGTIAGGNGASGRGYGAAGGGGGASTNGANSGAGANGNDGVVIVISVDYE